MNKNFIVTVDTEADWFHQKENRLNNIKGIHELQSMCSKYNIVPTYLITYEVATDKDSVRIIDKYLQKGLCEVGSHLHVWSTPPFDSPNQYNVDKKWFPAFQSELPNYLLYEKLESLHKAIVNNFGISPKSHRAGRWGIDNRTIKWLSQNNYLVDTSICSRKSWRLSRGVRNFINYNSHKVGNEPYFPSLKDITISSKNKVYKNGILEVPVSNLELKFWPNSNSKSFAITTTLLNKLGLYYFGNISFRPSYNIPLNKYKMMVNSLFEKNKPFLNYMFHSNELMEGLSPYSINKEEKESLIKRIEYVFKSANDYGYESIKLSDSRVLYKK